MKKLIEKALNEKNIKAESINFERLHRCGKTYEGGWEVYLDEESENKTGICLILGINSKSIIDQIKEINIKY